MKSTHAANEAHAAHSFQSTHAAHSFQSTHAAQTLTDPEGGQRAVRRVHRLPFGGFFEGKRVWITGHTGFKGAWLAHWLLELGAEVRGFSDRIPTRPSLFETTGLAARCGSPGGDIRDAKAVQAALADFSPEVVFHLAAQPLVRDSYDDPVGTLSTNVVGTAVILDAIRRAPSVKAAIVVTSDKCYENREWVWGYRESDPMGGKDPYSASKGCAELVFASFHRSFFAGSGVALASGRAGNVIGGGDWARDRIVPDCVRAWSEGKKVEIRYPESIRPWQHVLEPLSGYLWLAARLARGECASGESFNFGPLADAERTVADLIDAMAGHWDVPGFEVNVASRQGKAEAVLLKLSCEKARARLGWSAILPFADTIRMTAEWYRGFASDPEGASARTAEQIREYTELARAAGQAWATPG